MIIEVQNIKLQLLPEKAMYWPSIKSLFVADLHFGKVMHFRKAGIGIPTGAIHENLERFSSLLLNREVDTVYLLGDLFHSDENIEWQLFVELIEKFSHIKFILIIGNHDILPANMYNEINLEVFDQIKIENILFTHHPEEQIEKGYYNICGHIHPGIRLSGNARQSLRLPCFYFGESQGILPAFGAFTGTKTIKTKKGDQVFVIADDEIIKIN